MKKGILFLALVFISILWCGCTVVEPTRYDPGISLSTNAVSVKGDACRTIIKVTSQNSWVIEGCEECGWVSFSKSSGEYTEEIIMNVAENPSVTDGREVELKFTSEGVSRALTVTQAKFIANATLEINGRAYIFPDLSEESEMSYSATSEACTISMKLLANKDWKMDSGSAAWLKADKDSGKANISETVTLTLEENATGASRTATLNFKMGDMTLVVNLTQDKDRNYVILDDEVGVLQFDNVGAASYDLKVTANCAWEVSCPDWISAEPALGNGNATIRISSPGSVAVAGKRAEGTVIIKPAGTPGQDDQHVEIAAQRQGSLANTYCIKGAGSYSFPALDYDGNALTADSVDWIWNNTSEENITSNLSISSGIVTFSGTGVKGFEVIAALLNGKVVRIWNIWSTESLNEVQVGAAIYLDRNVGAPFTGYTDLDRDTFNPDCCGALFMWGVPTAYPSGKYSHTYWNGSRFEGSNVETVPFSSATSKFSFNSRFGSFSTYTANTSRKAYIDDILSSPWIIPLGNPATSANIYGESWNEWITFWQDNEKGKYDPCPAGYKVPTNSQLSTLVNSDLSNWDLKTPYVEGLPASSSAAPNGYSSTRIYSKDGVPFVLPTGGMRFNGNIIQLGGRTCYYTSTPNAVYKPYIINYDYSVGSYSDQHNRMYSIRCVKY